jgi:hypothetical protein
MADAGGNGTQREIGELFGKTDAIESAVAQLRSEVREGFAELRSEIGATVGAVRGEVAGCRAHEAGQLSNLMSVAMTNRTLAVRAVVLASIALAAVATLASWIVFHVAGK